MKIDNSFWSAVLDKKTRSLHSILVKKRDEIIADFMKKNAGEIAKRDALFKEHFAARVELSGLEYQLGMSQWELDRKLEKLVGDVRGSYRPEKYDPKSNNGERQYRPNVYKMPCPADHHYTGRHCTYDNLLSSGIPEYVKLANDFMDLKMSVELSDNADAKRLIDAFLDA